MKRKYINLAFSLCLLIGLMGCNENLTIHTVEQGSPQITSFTPSSGKMGTQVTVYGEQLRDVTSAMIGTDEVPIKYKISQKEIVLSIPAGISGGLIKLTSILGTTESETPFTIDHPSPVISDVLDEAKVGAQLEIKGTDMDVITSISFNDALATVVYQSTSELVVTVPFVLQDEAVFKYSFFTQEGEQSYELPNKINVIKPQPVLSSTMSTNVKEGEIILLEGENMNLFDKILFGETEATISKKDVDYISFRVPTLPSSGIVEVKGIYYEDTKEMTFQTACNVFIPKVFHYLDVEIGSHRNEIGNLVNATTGDVYSPCYLKSAAAEQNASLMEILDFAGYINGSLSFTFYGPQNTTGTIKNYWCNGTNISKSATLDALSAEGYGPFLGIQTFFLVLSEEIENENSVIQKVKQGSITEITPESFPDLFNGNLTPTSNTVRSRSKTESETTQTPLIFKTDNVVLFKNNKKGKVGLLWIKKLNIDYSASSTVANSTSSVVVDIYYER